MAFTRRAPNGLDGLNICAKDKRPGRLERCVEEAEAFYGRRGYVITWTRKNEVKWDGYAEPAKPLTGVTSKEADLLVWKRLSILQQKAMLELSMFHGCTGENYAYGPEKLEASTETLDELVEEGFVNAMGGSYSLLDYAKAYVAAAEDAGLVEVTWHECPGCREREDEEDYMHEGRYVLVGPRLFPDASATLGPEAP